MNVGYSGFPKLSAEYNVIIKLSIACHRVCGLMMVLFNPAGWGVVGCFTPNLVGGYAY